MPRYSAFISYSHADTPVAHWLHRALETYRVPTKLVGCPTPFGPAPRRLLPIFRDRDELPASGDLGTELRAALADAAFLTVICSPASAASHWVNEEILAFKALHGDGRVLALIASGEPYNAEHECFPPALRFKIGPGGVLTTEPAEPIAADIRPGKDGRRLAQMKLLAGLTGLKLDSLVRRDAARRQRRLTYIAGGALAVAAVTMLLALYALHQRNEAQRARNLAEAQRRTAEASLDFLIGTFQIANPATENPRTITAITLIHRVSDRVKTELRSQPRVSARLLRATGDIYINLGLFKDAERDFTVALTRDRSSGDGRAITLTRLARVANHAGDVKRARRLLDQARAEYAPGAAPSAPVEAAMLMEQGSLEQFDRRPARAVALFQRTATLYSRSGLDYRDKVAMALLNEGLSLIYLKAYARADDVLARAQGIDESLYGRDHLRTANVLQNRALNALNAGRLGDAERLVASAVAVYGRVLEPDHPENASVALLQGRIAHAQHDWHVAETAFRRAAAINTRLYGPLNFQVGDDYFYLAQSLSDQRRYPDALTAIANAKRAYDAAYGALDSDQAELLAIAAQVLRAAGRRGEAARDCDAAIAMRVRMDAHDPELPGVRAHCTALLADPPGVSLSFP